MPILNPPPGNIPPTLPAQGFFRSLIDTVFTIFYAIGGKDGKPTIFLRTNQDTGGIADYNELTGVTDTPTADPGWATSSTADMNAPDGYIKMYVGTQAVVVPYWNT